MKQYKLNVTTRSLTGRGANRRLRAQGKIPAVIYGPSGSWNLSIEKAEFYELWKEVAGASTLIQICKEENQPVGSLIQEVQRDPVTDEFVHIDFKEISVDKAIQTDVPVHVVGESVGVKNEGALIEVINHELSVRCFPQDLPQFIEVDITDLHAGMAIHVGDLKPIPRVTFNEEADKVVVLCVLPAAAEAEAQAEEVESVPKTTETKEAGSNVTAS